MHIPTHPDTSRHIPTFHRGQSCPVPVAEAHPVNEKTPKADAAVVVRGIGIIPVWIPINQVAALKRASISMANTFALFRIFDNEASMILSHAKHDSGSQLGRVWRDTHTHREREMSVCTHFVLKEFRYLWYSASWCVWALQLRATRTKSYQEVEFREKSNAGDMCCLCCFNEELF